jgi:ketosteroid isomerase-like protein
MATGTVTVETLQRLVDAFNTHDLDAVMGFFTDDCVLELPRGPDPWGCDLFEFRGDKIARKDSYWKLVEG